MIYDYYNPSAYNNYFYKFFNRTEKYCKPNKYLDMYLSFLELSDEEKEKYFEDFDIDEDAYLFYIIRRYAQTRKRKRKEFSTHPYINSIKIDKDQNHISTLLGDANFKFWIKGTSDILSNVMKNIGCNPINKTTQIFMDEYLGNYNGKCHEASIQFCGKNKVVTAFMHEPLYKLRYLHSFVEGEEKILETTANLVMDKEEYYRLTKPEVISELSKDDIDEYYNHLMKKYPRLENMSTKQFLTEFEEIKKNPKTIKLKPYINM